MDLISEVAKRESEDLQSRLANYESTVMFLSHEGDLMEIDGFTVVRIETLVDLATVKPGYIVAIDDEHVQLAKVIRENVDILGFNVVVLDDVPGQINAANVTAELGQFHRISFLRIMNDIADKRIVEENMTEAELEASVAKRQDALLRTKSGEIRPLIDFDRGYDVEQEIAPDGHK